jgi:ABC-type nitrate/sulfonate/bicarbonate transport system substrate-binding protein
MSHSYYRPVAAVAPLRSGVVLLCAIGAALCSSFVLAQTKITLGSAKDPNLGSQFVIARDRGFFRDAGLDAEIKYFPSGGDLMAAFVGGSVQMGSSGATPVTTLRARPYPVKIVSQISDISGAQQLIVKQNVKSLDELYGKRIGLLRGTASEALFNSIVKAYGFDASKVELIGMGPAEMLQGFVRGDLAGVSLWEPHSTRARKAGGGKILASGTQSYIAGKEGPNRIYGDHSILFATDTFVRENAATVRAVLTALARANDFIDKNRAEAIALLGKEFELDTADMAGIVAVNHYTLTLDDQMSADLNRLADFLFELKRIPSQVRAADWIDPAPLRAVRADLVKIK